MNPKIKKKWIKALTSGKYKQAKGMLRKGDAFCCLGVLCDLHSKEHKKEHWQPLDGHYDYLNNTAILSPSVWKWAGLKDGGEKHFGTVHKLICANDAGKKFKTIAKMIKESL
jgi:hypothetical protein